GKDLTNTGSSTFDKMENSSGNIKELSEKTVKSSDVITNIQNKDLNLNLGKPLKIPDKLSE
ncbi:273_t:CDS:1, partial [Gigaspora margarita]